MAAPGNDRGQMMLAEEYFAAEDDLFLETVRRVNQPKAVGGLADRWKKDPRPWARRQIFAYSNSMAAATPLRSCKKCLGTEIRGIEHDWHVASSLRVRADRRPGS